jgi:hypothetical protein
VNARASEDERLHALAEHLDYDLGARLRALIDADSRAGRVLELEDRAQRAEDLAAEIRRQMTGLQRLLDRAREAGFDPRPPMTPARPRLEVPVLPAPPPPPPAPRIH